jgi:predicted nucleotide-binding protein
LGEQVPRTGTPSVAQEPAPVAVKDPRQVFVVHGRNIAIKEAMFDFLRSVGLNPREWEELVAETGSASPYIGQVLKVAFEIAQAAVVLFTPDDEARLRELYRGAQEPTYETELTPQARQNVLFEAGMAMGWADHRTVLVQVGHTRPFSDIAGRHTVHLQNTEESRRILALRLRVAGCPVDITGSEWKTTGSFDIESTQT